VTDHAGGGGDGDGDDDDDEARAFEEATRGARPLPADPRVRRAPAPESAATRGPPARARPPAPDAGAAFEIQTTGETIAARAPGVDPRLVRRLRGGEIAVEATLDLHGRSRAQAERELGRFVAAARARGRRCLLVIHGRGNRSAADGPTLKPATWAWLTTSPEARAWVLALASAPAQHGGDGATLVLLRRAERR
jgi:DNA-nicking Smr family endonuclease